MTTASGQIDLKGKVALVTGGGSGIGLATGKALAARGAKVGLVDLDGAKAEAAAAGVPGAIGVGADVTSQERVDQVVAEVTTKLGPIDVYFSNAGMAGGAGLGDEAIWAKMWAVHGMAHVYAANALIEDMAGRGGCHFIITASAAGLLMTTGSAPYTATKHASLAIAEWLAVNHGSKVQLHCLCPQGVRTPLVPEEGYKELERAGAILEPEQVADEVLAAMDEGRFLITPHPEVHKYEQFKVADRDRWLAGMRRMVENL